MQRQAQYQLCWMAVALTNVSATKTDATIRLSLRYFGIVNRPIAQECPAVSRIKQVEGKVSPPAGKVWCAEASGPSVGW